MDSMGGRGAVIMKAFEARKAMPAMDEGGEAEEGGGLDKVREYCEEGKRAAEAFLESEEGQSSPLKAKVEAVVAACDDLVSAMEGAEEP